MADYGKNTIGASNEAISANNKRFCKFTSPADINAVDSITAYLNRTGAGGGYAIDGAIYADNAGAPGALVTNSPIEISSNIARNSPNWYSVNYVTKPTLSPNTPYWLGILATKASVTYFDTGAANQEAMNADTLPFDDPFGTPSYHAHAMSVYVSYTGGQTYYQSAGDASATITGTIVKMTSKSIGAASMTIAGVLATAKLIAQSVGGASMAMSGAMTIIWTRVLSVGSASMSITGALAKTTSKTLSGSISIVGSLTKATSKIMSGSMSIAGNLATTFIAGSAEFAQAVGEGVVNIAKALGIYYNLITRHEYNRFKVLIERIRGIEETKKK